MFGKKLVMASMFVAIGVGQVESALVTAVTGSGIYATGSSGKLTVGWEFTMNSPVTVKELGYYDYGQDGLAVSHDVGIWTKAGVLLVSGTVNPGDTLIGDFRYSQVLPTVLEAGQTYVIGGYNPYPNNETYVAYNTLVTNPALNYVGGLSSAGGLDYLSFPFDGIPPSILYTIFGPSYRFDGPPVPEPTSLVLWSGLGLMGLIAARRRRKRTA